MQKLHRILVEVKNGQRSFHPRDQSTESIQAFQATATRLQSALSNGYIRDAKFRVSHLRETHGCVLGAIVVGGLTFEGDQYVSAFGATQASTAEKAPIFQLKPTFAGMSIDLVALVKWLKSRFKR